MEFSQFQLVCGMKETPHVVGSFTNVCVVGRISHMLPVAVQKISATPFNPYVSEQRSASKWWTPGSTPGRKAGPSGVNSIESWMSFDSPARILSMSRRRSESWATAPSAVLNMTPHVEISIRLVSSSPAAWTLKRINRDVERPAGSHRYRRSPDRSKDPGKPILT